MKNARLSENTRRQQVAADALVTVAVLALGAVLVVAGRALAGDVAPGASGDWLRIAPTAFDGGTAPRVDTLLGLVSSITGLAVVAWWLLSAAIAMLSALLAAAGAHHAALCTGAFAPVFMRRLAMAMLGLSLVAAPAAHAEGLPDPAWHPAPVAVAAAAQQPAAEPAAHTVAAYPAAQAVAVSVANATSEGNTQVTPVPEAAWVPAAVPADPGPLVQQPTRAPAPAQADLVEVHPGDSLWTIVARHLGPGATDLEIAAAWPDWYSANATVIGDSPDIIRPGQLLTPPR